ncbi:putative ABC transport system permease protein [Dyadobacter soli]|uniref:Putative ABC transport system permease protein n=1 Tax=Dyadobacter soli TaxID=659014 RepID=A0A1G7HGA9_9BACT|nr:ABC transporter permease [Dyadobacter soli]SDE99391.1 putative ABC transport system permease protein [Dyadobacter soli]
MLFNYLKISIRNFRKQRLFSALNILGLGIGIAAVWLMVLYVADELSYDRFHTKADRIYRVTQQSEWATGSFNLASTSAPFSPALQNEYPEIEKAVRISAEGGGKIRFGEKQVDAYDVFFTDASVFDIFSYSFLYGDPKTALREPQKIVLTKTLATRIFGDAAKAMGQTVFFSNNFPNVVTGVIEDVPTNSHLVFSALRSLPPDFTGGWQDGDIYTYLLLKEGTDARKLEAKFPAFYTKYLKKEMGDADYRMNLQPLTSIHLHSHLGFEFSTNGNIKTVYIFSAIALLILVIACINYMNLYTARSLKRVREVGVRKAIGSQRFQLIGQFLTESFMMTILAGFVGFLLASAALPFFNRLAEKSLSLDFHDNNIATIAIAVAFLLLIGLLSGLYPALMLSGYRPVIALKGQLGSQTGGAGFRQSLVVFQFAATVVMIACSGIVYRQIRYVNQKDLGFNKDQVLTFHIDKSEVRTQVGALKEKLGQNPLIESSAAASNPIGNNFIGSTGLLIETSNGEIPSTTQMTQRFMADADYLRTMEIKLLQGRDFIKNSPADLAGSVLVNEALVKKQGWTNPIGKRMRYPADKDGNVTELTIVGVTNDFHIYSLQHKIEPLVIQFAPPTEQDNMYVRINAAKTPEALAYISQVYKTFDAEARPEFQFLDENFAKQYQAEQRQGNVLLAFAVLAIVIACLGLFGLAAFAAEARTKEIGVRKVLGASVQNVVLMLSKDFIKLVLIAIVIGTPIAVYSMNKWLENFEYRETLSWWIFALAGIIAIVIALATVSSQALKSALTNPVKALRAE